VQAPSLSRVGPLAAEFSRVYGRLSREDPPVSLRAFVLRSPEDIRLRLEQGWDGAAAPQGLEPLEGLITGLVNLASDLVATTPPGHPDHSLGHLFLSRMQYLRAYLLVCLKQFCEAAMETSEAVGALKGIPAYGADPARICAEARTMFQGLMNVVFGRYYSGQSYVPSDCLTSCSYCQDPLSTLARFGARSLADLDGLREVRQGVDSLWGMAAAMLAAYVVSKGGDPWAGRFPEAVAPAARTALRLIVRDEKPGRFPWGELVQDYRLILEG